MKTKTFKVGRYRLTEAFAKRALTHYSRRIRQKEMPAEIARDIVDGTKFAKQTRTKFEALIHHPELGAEKAETSIGDREIHDALCRAASVFGLPAPAAPQWPEPPKPEPEKQDQPEQQPQQQKPQAGDGKGEEQPGEGQGEPGDDQDSQGEGSGGDGDGEGEGDEGDGDGNGVTDEECDSESDQAGSGSSAGSSKNVKVDPAAVKEAMGRIIDRATADAVPPPPSKIDPIREGSGLLPEHDLDSTRRTNPGMFASADMLHRSNQLIAMLKASLMSVSRHRHHRDRDNGDVDTDTKLVDIAARTDLERVFVKTTQARRLNTAVQVLVDISGSMNDGMGMVNGQFRNKLGTAKECVTLIGESLERLRVPVEIIAYESIPYTVKPWHEKMAQAASKIERLWPTGGTRLTKAVSSGAKSLAERREERLVQLVITDGDIGASDVIAAVKAKTRRLEVFAFGLGVNLSAQVNQLEAQYSANAKYRADTGDNTGAAEFKTKGIKCREAFDKVVDNLTTANMSEVIIEKLREALVSDRHRHR